MLHVLPSEVVQHIDRSFPWVTGTDLPALGAHNAGEVAGVIALVDAVPPHLLMAQSGRYAQLLSSVAQLRSWLPTWEARGTSWTVKGQPLRVVRNVLAGCPDEFPAPTTQGPNLHQRSDAARRPATRHRTCGPCARLRGNAPRRPPADGTRLVGVPIPLPVLRCSRSACR
jgi:hypothetical protein